jgi:lysine biosynthesis protein LysW
MATCPECDADIEIDDDDLAEMEIGDPWDCDACGTRLRVANLDPLDFETDDEDEDEDAVAEEKEDDAVEGEVDEDVDDVDEDGEDWDE